MKARISIPAGVAVFAVLALAGLMGLLALNPAPPTEAQQDSDGRPVIEEAPAAFTHVENNSERDYVYTFRATDPEGQEVYWSLGGVDADDFTIAGGKLAFKSPPDYEYPLDATETNTKADASDNQYDVTVRFSDGGGPAGEHAVTVNVTNEEEMGMVLLSPRLPQVGSVVTAIVVDYDGEVIVDTYQWYKSATMSGTPAMIEGADEETYTPAPEDEGSYLTVKARYTDGYAPTISGRPQVDEKMVTSKMPVRADTTHNIGPDIPDQDLSMTSPQITETTRVVPENMPPGTRVGPPVTAVDDNVDPLTYAFGGTADQMTAAESFKIDPSTGQITTKRPLSRNMSTATPPVEEDTTHTVVVKGTDPDGDPSQVVVITVAITVTNVDEPPVFPDGTARAFKLEFNVQEGGTLLYTTATPPDAAVPADYTFTANDPEGATPIIWSLEGDDSKLEIDDSGVFSISNEDATRGQLSVGGGLDFEAPKDADEDNVYELTVVATDSKYEDAKQSKLSVTVKVRDVEEGQSQGKMMIFNRNPEVGTPLYLGARQVDRLSMLTADDLLTDPNGGVRDIKWQWYRATAAPVSDPSAATACTAPAVSTDAERAAVDPDRSGTDWEKIDRATRSSYQPSEYLDNPDEETDAGRCLMVRASYKDNGPEKANVVTSSPDPYDESRQHAYAFSENTVIRRIEDNPPPVFVDGDTAFVGIQVRQKVEENITLDETTGLFSIFPAVGLADGTSLPGSCQSAGSAAPLTVAADTRGTIRAYDGTFTDANDDGTIGPCEGTYGPIDFTSATASATDRLTFTLEGPDAKSFNVDRVTGAIDIKSKVNYEKKNSYLIVLKATDPRNATATIRVLVDVVDKDEPAAFSDPMGAAVHKENSDATVAIFTASDPDVGKFNNAFRFDLAGDDAALFTLTKVTGILKFKEAPNFEAPNDGGATVTCPSATPGECDNIYNVTINLRQDTDGDGEIETTGSDDPPLGTSPTVMIKVVDVPESPEFSSDSVALDIDENKYPNMDLNRVVEESPQAYDDDMHHRVSLHYTLSGAGADVFDIVPVTGELRTAEVLDYERLANKVYQVKVTATDHTHPQGLSDSIDVTITVNNVDEPAMGRGDNQPPAFPSGPMTREVAENTDAGMDIGAPVMATDPENTAITYALGGADAAHFGIDRNTGQLRVRGSLDYEAKSSYTVTVTATDSDATQPMSSDPVTVTITVTNADEDGEVTLSAMRPMVGEAITASLTDPDGSISGATWQWHKSSDMRTWMPATGAGAATMTYTPAAADDGYYLRAAASYTDAEGSGKNAMKATTAMVTVDPNAALIAKFDTEGDGLDRDDVIAAIRRYLGGDTTIDRDDVIAVIRLYLSS